jgi:tetratricopeptide (TPR) repeat protein
MGWYPIAAFAALFVVLIAGAWVVYLSVKNPINGTGPAVATAWEHLEIPKARYTPPPPDLQLRKPSKAFDSAMAAYEANDYAGAIEQLETLTELEPANAADVHFYLGISLLMVDRKEDAIIRLKEALQFSSGAQNESRHYYLALAYLKENDLQQATVELDKVIEMRGEYGQAARDLKQKIIVQTN